jgi:hypothetical protein
MNENPTTIRRIANSIDLSSFEAPEWNRAKPVFIATYWSGESAPAERAVQVSLLGSESDLFVRFDARQHEPLVISDNPDLSRKAIGLWERDVCEMFLAPDCGEPRKYFEFEVAPTGEWLDLAIDSTGRERKTDWEYHSGMEAAARVDEHRVIMAIKIPWTAFSRKPAAGDVWLGNFFRCVGNGPNRGYLAHRPTMTETPNFHVPESFGQLFFEN